jgi:hypothetical protein
MRRTWWRLVVGLAVVAAGAGLAAVQSQRRAAQPTAQPTAATQVREPAVAGSFYPAESSALRKAVEQFIGQAQVARERGELIALIVPHAGYEYSGKVAGCAYRQIEGRKYDTVVIVGPSHRVPFRGVALSGAGAWRTPLGHVPIDADAERAVAAADSKAQVLPEAHEVEHSVEVQVPFLQCTLKRFALVPVTMVDFSQTNCEALASALASIARRKRVLLVASSDMSHYPDYADAVRVDKATLRAIETLDARAVEKAAAREMSAGTANLATVLCGEGPVKTILMAARKLGANRVRVLRYANSGDVSGGDRSRVVGYCAVAIYRVKGLRAPGLREPGSPQALNLLQQKRLLRFARTAIEKYVTSREVVECRERDDALLQSAGAFVTLKKQGALRGCIGRMEARGPLCTTVRDMAIAAAVQDRRFPPVTKEELPELKIEISVLSPLRRVSNPGEIDIKKHGIVVESDGSSGVFLPQVARETGWSKEVLLSELCGQKAGLPRDAWKHGATLYVFTVQEFHE